MTLRMTAEEIAECAHLADVVDGPVSTAGADAYDRLGWRRKQMARELAAREDERAAWARLVKAERDIVDCQRGEIQGARAEQAAARQALRDLGVDVDALLAD
jgi:hypothetical protein